MLTWFCIRYMQESLQVSILSQKYLPGGFTSWQYTCTYSNLKAGLVIVVYLNNQKVVASANCSVILHKILNCIMNFISPADPLDNVNNEENLTTSDHKVQLSTGLSAEDMQRIITTVAALVGRPSSSNNNFQVSSPSQVPTPPTADTEFVYHVVYSWYNLTPPRYPICHG